MVILGNHNIFVHRCMLSSLNIREKDKNELETKVL